MLNKALDYIVSVVVQNEEVQKLPKDFVTASMRWIRSWFLEDDPTTEKLVNSDKTSENTKREVIDSKLQDLQHNEQFMKELATQLAALEAARAKQRTQKNVVEGSEIEAAGNVRLGDNGQANNETPYDEKNTVKGSKIKAGGDVQIGDSYTIHAENLTIHAAPQKVKTDTATFKAALQKHIAQGNPQKAIDELIDFQNKKGGDNHEVFALSGRLQDLVRQKRGGLITDDGASTKRNNIVDALLKLIDEVGE